MMGKTKISVEAFLHTALGGNRNVATLTFLSLVKLLQAYAEHLLVIIDRQAEEISSYTTTNVELLSERDTLAEQLKAKDEVEVHLRKSWHEAEEMLVIVRADCAKYEHLNETVALTCTPPDDCNDPVVLKRYMKACFDAVVEDEDIAK